MLIAAAAPLPAHDSAASPLPWAVQAADVSAHPTPAGNPTEPHSEGWLHSRERASTHTCRGTPIASKLPVVLRSTSHFADEP